MITYSRDALSETVIAVGNAFGERIVDKANFLEKGMNPLVRIF